MKHRQESLDPENWETMTELGHQMIDDMMEYLQKIDQKPVWQPAPEIIKTHFDTPLPSEPQPITEIYREFQDYVLPHPIGNIHPRFWGWIFGTGTVTGALAEFL
ncbi:MAG: amino acid decarboxylase, partial [Chloroflexota bacterium]